MLNYIKVGMGIAVEDVVVKSRLLRYDHIIYQGTKTQIHEVLQFEMARKRQKEDQGRCA